ncbi:MAG: hypothetical protein NVS9B1_15470 [Candidatus Dormibacteraceae bacterium]
MDLDPVAAGIWIATLAIVVLITPLVLYHCWRLIRGAHNIERHFYVTLQAAVGVVGNTSHVKALEDTIGVAGGMLETAGNLDAHSAAIEGLLISRLPKAGA